MRTLCLLLSGGLHLALSAGLALGDEPLHVRIDRLIAAGIAEYDSLAAPLASDAEFLRRVSLDLTGMVPTTEQVRQFLADEDAGKRERLIARLLDSPESARHLQRTFDVMLMRRLPQKHVPVAEWEAFLRTAFAEDRPWDETVRDILAADGADAEARGPARFYLDRDGDVDEITRDIGRVFLGANLECAQCHDHPEVGDWRQDHYYGVAAYLVRSFVFTDQKPPVFAEKAEGEVSFESVFEVRDKKSSGPKSAPPRLFDADPIDEPEFAKGEEYEVQPAKGVRPVPKFSRRTLLPEAITGAPRFARTTANRLWAVMFGRGLVHPLDYDHTYNPPSHPELLDLLAEELAAGGFSVKCFLRELALTQTYQRSSRREADGASEIKEPMFAQALLKPLSPAQFAWAMVQATGEADVHRAALNDKLTEEALHQRLAGHENNFVRLFGGLPGAPPEDFESTVDQVLFLSNAAAVLGLIRPKTGNLADRMLKLPADDPQSIAEELFLSVLTRPPTVEDIEDVDEYLAGRDGESRAAAVQELVWALLTSSEFRFNH